jgi:HEAT repeat protein
MDRSRLHGIGRSLATVAIVGGCAAWYVAFMPRLESHYRRVELVRLMRDADPRARDYAATLTRDQSAGALDAVRDAMHDESPMIRIEAFHVLYQLRPDDPATLDALIGGLHDPDPMIDREIMIIISQAIGRMTHPRVNSLRAATILAALIPVVATARDDVKEEAFKTIGAWTRLLDKRDPEQEPLRDSAIETLDRGLSDRNQDVKVAAAEGLAALGSDSRRFIPKIFAIADSPALDQEPYYLPSHRYRRLLLLHCIQSIDPSGAAAYDATIVAWLGSLDPLKREQGARFLVEIDHERFDAIAQALDQLLASPLLKTRFEASKALFARNRLERRDLIESILVEMGRSLDEDLEKRIGSIRMLKSLGATGIGSIVDQATRDLADPSLSDYQYEIFLTLCEIGPEARSALPLILREHADSRSNLAHSPFFDELVARINPAIADHKTR